MPSLTAGEPPPAGLAREAAEAQEQTIADLFLHPVLGETTPEVLDQIPHLLESGCNTIKYFMSTPTFDGQVRGYVEATRRAGASDLLTLIHCEDDALMADAAAQLTAAGQTSLRYYAESRPVISEVVATQRAVAIAEATGAPVYIVHLSSERSLEVCADAQARGVPVYVETRPFYLHLTRERFAEEEGAKYVGQPPLREQRDVDALWAGIQQGVLNTVCTDHAPWSLAAKLDPDLTITRLRPGGENLQTMLPMLYSEGVRAGRSPKNGGGLCALGMTIVRPTANTGTCSDSATSCSAYSAPSQMRASNGHSCLIRTRSWKWFSIWLTKNLSSSNEISLGPLSLARSGNSSSRLLAMTSVACS